jgi:hypothetical protein
VSPHRIDPARFPDRVKVQFVTFTAMPHLIYQACLATDTMSNTVYIQHALCAALARDLGLDEAKLLADLPPPRGPASQRVDRAYGQRIGPAGTDEEVH